VLLSIEGLLAPPRPYCRQRKHESQVEQAAGFRTYTPALLLEHPVLPVPREQLWTVTKSLESRSSASGRRTNTRGFRLMEYWSVLPFSREPWKRREGLVCPTRVVSTGRWAPVRSLDRPALLIRSLSPLKF
jgi:hypothetical protein